MFQIAQQHARRTKDGRGTRNDEQRDFQFLSNHRRMNRSCTPGDDEREIARVITATDGHFADPVCHVTIDDIEHACRRLFHRHVQRTGDILFNRGARLFGIQFQFAAEKKVGTQITDCKSASVQVGFSPPRP